MTALTGASDASEVCQAHTTAHTHEFAWLYNGDTVRGEFMDTAGQEQYVSLRKLAYRGTHVAVVGFSLVDPLTLENIVGNNGWIDELRGTLPGFTSTILVGLKHDAWDSTNKEHCQVSRIQQVSARCWGSFTGKYLIRSLRLYEPGISYTPQHSPDTTARYSLH